MLIKTEVRLGYQLRLQRESNTFQVAIHDRTGTFVGSTMQHVEAKSALEEACRFVDQHARQRRR